MALSPSGLLTRLSGKHLHVHVCGFKSTTQGSSFFLKRDCHGCVALLCVFCMALLAFSSFSISH